MTEPTYQITPDQQFLLDQNPQFHPVSFLDDGDLIICEDAGRLAEGTDQPVLSLWGVWLLTIEGKVQGLAFHYNNHHDWQNERPGRPTTQHATRNMQHVPRIIDTTEASQYLLLKYRVDVTPRTVRNWLRDGKLAGGQLGDAERAPWYTTRDTIDQASKRDWFPPPLPDIPTLDQVDPRAPADWVAISTADLDLAEKDRVMEELAENARLGHLLADVDDTEQEANDGLPTNEPG